MALTDSADLAIAGAGPVGLATAIFAARAGLHAVVLERRRGEPIDKACGEGIMPRGVALLRELGVELPGRPFEGVRFFSRGAIAEGHFPREPGRGVRRTALSGALRERARALGVEVVSGAAVRDWRETGDRVRVETTAGALSAAWLIGADGLHSIVRRQSGLERRSRTPERYGIRRHFRVEPWSSLVEVHWVDDAEAYVTPVARDEVGIAILWRGDGRRFDDLLALFPALHARLRGAEPTSDVSGAGPFSRRARRSHRGRVVLVATRRGVSIRSRARESRWASCRRNRSSRRSQAELRCAPTRGGGAACWPCRAGSRACCCSPRTARACGTGSCRSSRGARCCSTASSH